MQAQVPSSFVFTSSGVDGKSCSFFAQIWRADALLILDDRQVTHLICVRLQDLLYDLLGGVLGLLAVVSL